MFQYFMKSFGRFESEDVKLFFLYLRVLEMDI